MKIRWNRELMLNQFQLNHEEALEVTKNARQLNQSGDLEAEICGQGGEYAGPYILFGDPSSYHQKMGYVLELAKANKNDTGRDHPLLPIDFKSSKMSSKTKASPLEYNLLVPANNMDRTLTYIGLLFEVDPSDPQALYRPFTGYLTGWALGSDFPDKPTTQFGNGLCYYVDLDARYARPAKDANGNIIQVKLPQVHKFPPLVWKQHEWKDL